MKTEEKRSGHQGDRTRELYEREGGGSRAVASYSGRSKARTGLAPKARREANEHRDRSSVEAYAPVEPHTEERDADRQEIFAPRIEESGAQHAFMARQVEAVNRTQTILDEEKSYRAQAGRQVQREEDALGPAKAKGVAPASTVIAPARRSKRADEPYTRVRALDFSTPRPIEREATPHRSPAAGAPALIFEETRNEAKPMPPSMSAVGQSSENPWPDLPVAPPPDPLDEAAAFEGELRRSQRLEREQRGMWWNA